MKQEPRYSIEVYDDYALIQGSLSISVLRLLVNLCKREGFTHIMNNEEKPGFKLVRQEN